MKFIALMSLFISIATSAGIVNDSPIKCQNERYTFNIQSVVDSLNSTALEIIGKRSEYFEESILTGQAGNSGFTVITYGADCRNLANTGELFSPVEYFSDSFNSEFLGDYSESLELIGTDSHLSESGIEVLILEKKKKSAVIMITQPLTGLVIKVLAKKTR